LRGYRRGGEKRERGYSYITKDEAPLVKRGDAA